MRLILLFILITGVCRAQHSGFFGKKNYIEIIGVGSVPVIDNVFSKNNTPYKANGSQLIEVRDWFEGGIRLAIGHSVNNQLGLGIEVGMDFQNVAPPQNHYGFAPGSDYIIKHELLDLRTISIIPKIEFTNADGLLPIGLNHQIGFGYTSTKVVDKNYVLKFNGTIGATETLKLAPIEDRFRGFVIFYALNMRTAVTKHLMLNYGIRYSVNGMIALLEPTNISTGYQVSRFEIAQVIRGRRFRSLLTFNLGLSVPF